MLAEVLRKFGLHVPGAEVESATIARRSAEPQWVVDLHATILAAAGVRPADDRPITWHLVDRANVDANASRQIRAWLAAQTAQHSALVVKDPRLPWFLEHWQAAAAGVRATASSITVLSPPLEVVGRSLTSDAEQDPTDRVAGWINLMLGTELATRATPRAFIRHGDLVHDWDGPVFAAAASLDLPMIGRDQLAAVERVDALIDPTPG